MFFFFFFFGGGFRGLRVPSLKVEGSEELAMYRFWPVSIWTPKEGDPKLRELPTRTRRELKPQRHPRKS